MSKKFTPPTMLEVKARAAEIGLSEREAERMWLWYDSKGWKVGSSPMKQWKSSLALWKMNCDERDIARAQNNRTGADTVVQGQEYQRILTRMATLKSTYGDAQVWCKEDVAEFRTLKARKEQLKSILGIHI